MDNIIEIIYNLAFYITLLSLALSFVRFIKGPTLADRVIALDSMTVVAISILVFLAFIFDRIIYLDVSLVYGLLSFLGVIAAARYLEGGL